MAEAHQGVAFSFAVTEDEGLHMNVSLEAVKAVLLSGLRSFRKNFLRFVNGVLNGVYPSHPLRGILFMGFVTGLKKYKNIDASFGLIAVIQNKIPRSLSLPKDKEELAACGIFASGAWLGMVIFRRYSLQALLSYHGWMYEERGTTSWQSKIWYPLMGLMLGSNPKLFSYQNSLPSIPVPDLNKTITRYLRTIKPLYNEEDFKRIEAEAVKFQNGVGKRLQRYLIFKSYIAANYVSDWWEEYVYLRGRSPIMVNSNFYALDTVRELGSSIQAARAANVITAIFMYRKKLDNEEVKPIILQKYIPLCSRQYERQFNTTRIPGEQTDTLVHHKDSKHVAVFSNGKWYKLYTYYQSKNLNARELETQIQKILDDDSSVTNTEQKIAALTAGERVPWAQARKKFFSRGVNRISLNAIERAAFVVILENVDYPYTSNEKGELDTFAKAMLGGQGYDRWFDKSFNLIVARNGRVGLNVEHAWADAPITGVLWEYSLSDDIFTLGYDSEGHCKGVIRFEELPDPRRLSWEINKKLEEQINASYTLAKNIIDDVDLHIVFHDNFGKGFIKKCKTSPDAFIQMALQLAYYRDIGRNHLTYESSMTRMFKEGRTETVRSCSIESCDWVKAMVNPNATSEEKIKLFKKATNYHVLQYKDAMTGNAVDRHIFCLYVVSRYLEIDTPFLKEVLSEPWRLSTSQSPTAQTDKLNFEKNPETISAGGGFGPVADDGYGVSYIIVGEDTIFFHVSSKKSSEKTDSIRFSNNIKQAMQDIHDLFSNSTKK